MDSEAPHSGGLWANLGLFNVIYVHLILSLIFRFRFSSSYFIVCFSSAASCPLSHCRSDDQASQRWSETRTKVHGCNMLYYARSVKHVQQRVR